MYTNCAQGCVAAIRSLESRKNKWRNKNFVILVMNIIYTHTRTHTASKFKHRKTYTWTRNKCVLGRCLQVGSNSKLPLA